MMRIYLKNNHGRPTTTTTTTKRVAICDQFLVQNHHHHHYHYHHHHLFENTGGKNKVINKIKHVKTSVPLDRKAKQHY